MRLALRLLAPLALATPTLALADPGGPSFTPLGDLAGGQFYSDGLALSNDGSTVAGSSFSNRGLETTRWTSTGGLTGLGDLPGGQFSSFAFGISADGSTIVGQGSGAMGGEATRWTQATGMVSLGSLPGGSNFSWATGASGNGSVISGLSLSGAGGEAFRWTQATGMVGLGDLPGGSFNSEANGISTDGSTIVGAGTTAVGQVPVRWTSGGISSLSLLPDASGGNALTTSADGAVIAGLVSYTDPNRGYEAFRWTESGGMVGLGDLGGLSASAATGMSDDGSVIVGNFYSATGQRAFIWDGTYGMRDLTDALNSQGLLPTGWTLTTANDVVIAPNGMIVIAGTGVDPNGNSQAFVAAVPEPATLAVLGLGGLALARRRRRN